VKSSHLLLIPLLLGMLGLYFYERHQRLTLADALESAQAAADETVDLYEERLARLRFELEEQLQQRHGLEGLQALRDLQETLRDQRLRAQEQTLHEVGISLGLDEESSRLLRSALRRFDGGKRRLISEARAEGSFLGEAHQRRIDELRQEVLALLDELLSDTQLEQFFRLGFADRLDLVMSEDDQR